MTDNDKKIIPVLRHAAARMVMNKAAITMSVQFGEGGFTITDASGMKDNRNEGKSDAGDARLLRFADENLSSAQKLMSNVVKLLNGLASQSIFPEYYSSNKYVDPNAPKVAPRNNENRRVFGM
jgi:hypothetical protein